MIQLAHVGLCLHWNQPDCLRSRSRHGDPMQPPFETTIRTQRLLLRPFAVEDAERVVEIQSDWAVVRMLRAATWPATLEATRAWLAGHRGEWRARAAYRFAITLDGEVIGCVDIDEITKESGSLGYWLGRSFWGRGLATEAAQGLIGWVFAHAGLTGLDSGCAADNAAPAHVLEKLGSNASVTRRCGRTRGARPSTSSASA
jgi:RimJ/RimL family protein N-acetyltransferase